MGTWYIGIRVVRIKSGTGVQYIQHNKRDKTEQNWTHPFPMLRILQANRWLYNYNTPVISKLLQTCITHSILHQKSSNFHIVSTTFPRAVCTRQIGQTHPVLICFRGNIGKFHSLCCIPVPGLILATRSLSLPCHCIVMSIMMAKQRNSL